MAWWLLWKRKVQGEDVSRLEGWKPGGPSLSGGNFLGARMPLPDLRGIDLSQSNLNEADLRNANLEGANLRGAVLNHADLRKSNLRRSSLSGAELVGTDLRESDLRRSNLSGILTQPTIPEDLQTVAPKAATTNLCDANLQHANLSGADLRGADLRGADLKRAHYSDQTLWPSGFLVESSGARRVDPCRVLAAQPAISVPGYGDLPMSRISAGTFWMGSFDADRSSHADEKPRHEVTLTRGFWLGRTPVPLGLYRSITGENPSRFKTSDHYPVETVSWFDAVRFCNRLSQVCGLDAFYTIGEGTAPDVTVNVGANGFRLPTESEWECAARAGEDFRYSGADDPDTVAWHIGNSGGSTHSVGLKTANAWGLYDMSGNVWEWCWDWVGSYPTTARVDPVGPRDGAFRVLRGGSWYDGSASTRTASRSKSSPASARHYVGFRLARS